MKFNTQLSEEIKQQIFNAYRTSFPEDERRAEKDFWKLFNNPNAQIISISENEIPVGYLVNWKIADFIFIEHFEVFKTFRGQNTGSKILEKLAKEHSHLILETEPENFNEIATRRIKFYERNHFFILDKNYIQPSYGRGKNAINLWLMGTFTPDDLVKTISEIHKIVYQKTT